MNEVHAGSVQDSELPAGSFAPLPVAALPFCGGAERWQPLIAALPDLDGPVAVPMAMTVDVGVAQVKLFLPGFDKTQVKLTQYGPELTIEAGDQRRNILLPDGLRGNPVTGAKFQDSYLIISF